MRTLVIDAAALARNLDRLRRAASARIIGVVKEFAGKYKKELLALEGDQGGRQIMQEHPEDIWMMEVDERELRDIDHPADLKQLRLELEHS